MALIVYKVTYDNLHRPIEHYFDTDDMSQDDYSRYCELKSNLEKLKSLKSKGISRINLVYGIDYYDEVHKIEKEIRKIIRCYT